MERNVEGGCGIISTKDMNKEEIIAYQHKQLELMKTIHSICENLEIKYYIIGGTLLGAIRHGGFIPWDADIDIAMRRNDYERFRKYWENNPSENYFYDHYTTDPHHTSPHALLRLRKTHVVMKHKATQLKPLCDGVYVDIFPLDFAPFTEKQQKRQMKRIKWIRKLIYHKAGYVFGEKTSQGKRIMKKIVCGILSPLSFTFLNNKLDNIMRMYNRCDSGLLVSMASHYSYWKQLMPEEIYGVPQELDYEDTKLMAPQEPIEYLKRIYGDYMKLPPEEKRYTEIEMIDKVIL